MKDFAHYFDWAATAPADEEIQKEALSISLEHWGNPSSIHKAGTDAREELEKARKSCADSLGVSEDTIFFTSGGTEGDHIPLLSMLTRPQKGHIVLSSIEHPALREMVKSMENCGWSVTRVEADKNGFVKAEDVTNALQPDTAFVSVMAVNNETGAIQNVKAIADAVEEKCRGKRLPLFHADCVQAAGKIPIDFLGKNIHSASLSAHKIGGPRGVGILYLSKDIKSFLRGGGQEKGIRSGTENLFGAAAMALCLKKYLISTKNPASIERFEEQKEWTLKFMEEIMQVKTCSIIPRCRYENQEEFGKNFSPWIVQAAFPGIPGQVMQRALSQKGFYISTGSACSSQSKARPVLDSLHISAQEKESAVRFSFGFGTSKDSMQELAKAVKEVCKDFGLI